MCTIISLPETISPIVSKYCSSMGSSPLYQATTITTDSVAPIAAKAENRISMNPLNKHIRLRLQHATLLHDLSPCPRGRVGAVIYDPDSNAVISDGYNGPPRKGGELCGGAICRRTEEGVVSGTRCEIGCHHAEMNALLNALRLGQSTLGMHIIITCEPCLMCAKMIHHAGIVRVLYLQQHYASIEGVLYLKQHLGDENVYVLRDLISEDSCKRRGELP